MLTGRGAAPLRSRRHQREQRDGRQQHRQHARVPDQQSDGGEHGQQPGPGRAHGMREAHAGDARERQEQRSDATAQARSGHRGDRRWRRGWQQAAIGDDHDRGGEQQERITAVAGCGWHAEKPRQPHDRRVAPRWRLRDGAWRAQPSADAQHGHGSAAVAHAAPLAQAVGWCHGRHGYAYGTMLPHHRPPLRLLLLLLLAIVAAPAMEGVKWSHEGATLFLNISKAEAINEVPVAGMLGITFHDGWRVYFPRRALTQIDQRSGGTTVLLTFPDGFDFGGRGRITTVNLQTKIELSALVGRLDLPERPMQPR